MKLRNLALVALALLLPLGAVACSSDSTGDLSVSDMSAQLQKEAKIPKKQADCIAEGLKKADFTKKDLDSLGKAGAQPDTKSGKYKEYMNAITSCLGIPASTGTSTP